MMVYEKRINLFDSPSASGRGSFFGLGGVGMPQERSQQPEEKKDFKAIVLVAPGKFVEITSSGQIDELTRDFLLLDEADFEGLRRRGIFDKIEVLRQGRRFTKLDKLFNVSPEEGGLLEEEKGALRDQIRKSKGQDQIDDDEFGKINILAFRVREKFDQLKREIEEVERVLNGQNPVPPGMALIHPLVCTICASEGYYYWGSKSVSKIISRYPLILLHEGIARVEMIPGDENRIHIGQKVIVNPLKTPCDCLSREKKCYACRHGQRGLCEETDFMGSSSHGLARSHLLYPIDLLFPYHNEIPDEVAAMTELVAICNYAVRYSRLHERFPVYDRIAVIGTGPMGYSLLALLAFLFKVPKEQLFYIGRTGHKLRKAEAFATLVNSELIGSNYEFKGREFLYDEDNRVQIVFECAGGTGMDRTINTAIKILVPGGICYVLGLSDRSVPTNWIDAVNKGLQFAGVTRSRRGDFEKVLRSLRDNSGLIKVLQDGVKMWGVVEDANKLKEVFEFAHPLEEKHKPGERVAVDISGLRGIIS